MFSDNLIHLRKLHQMTQEQVAEKVGVTRQSVAKWEAGETAPDLDKCKRLSDLFGVSLDDLVGDAVEEEDIKLGIPPRGKHLFGVVTVGDKGQIVIPARARKVFQIAPGDQLVVLGDEGRGLAMMKSQSFLALADMVRRMQGN